MKKNNFPKYKLNIRDQAIFLYILINIIMIPINNSNNINPIMGNTIMYHIDVDPDFQKILNI